VNWDYSTGGGNKKKLQSLSGYHVGCGHFEDQEGDVRIGLRWILGEVCYSVFFE